MAKSTTCEARTRVASVPSTNDETNESSSSRGLPPPQVRDIVPAPAPQPAEDQVERLVDPVVQPQPIIPANDVHDVIVPPLVEICPAVYRAPAALLASFQALFVKIGQALVAAVEAGDSAKQSQAMLAMPILLYGVSEQREIRRRKRLIMLLVDSGDPVSECLAEVSRLRPSQSPTAQHRQAEEQGHHLPRRAIVELVEAGLAGKAVRRLEGHLDGGTVVLDEASRVEVIQLHPVGQLGLPLGNQNVDGVRISAAELADVLAQAPRLSAAGLSGWTYDLIRSVVSDAACCDLAARILSLMAEGKMVGTDLWLRSRLVLLSKPGGSVRPLAVGEAWTRVLGRALAKRCCNRAKTHLSPFQLGIGVKGGVEVAAHLVQTAVRAVRRGDADLVVQTVDFANAFNTVSRLSITAEIDSHLPDLSKYVRWAYGGASPLYSGASRVVDATSGVRQGDPLGPLLFSMALQPALRQVGEGIPEVDIVAYLDDVYLIGPKDAVARAFELLETTASRVGLQIKPQKSHLIEEHSQGIVALGAPSGSDGFVDDSLMECLTKQAAVLKQIEEFEVRHALAMVRASVSTRPMFWARTTLPDRGVEAFDAFDSAIDRTLAKLSGGSTLSLSDAGKAIRHLPVGLGGLGMRRFGLVRDECWAASFHTAVPFLRSLKQLGQHQEVATLLTVQRQIISASEVDAPRPPENDEVAERPVLQKALMKRVDERVKGDLLTLFQNSAIVAWLRSAMCPEAVSWLVESGSKGHDRNLHDDLVQMGLRLRLCEEMLPAPAEGARFTCSCNFEAPTSFELAVHALGCGKFSELRTGRHNAVRTYLSRTLKGLGLGAHVDEEVILQRPVDRPGDGRPRQQSDVRWMRGAEVIHFDIAVVSPSTPFAVSKGSHEQLLVASSEAESAKRRQYEVALQFADLQQSAFRPVVFETSGRPGLEADLVSKWIMEKQSGGGYLPEHPRKFLLKSSQAIWLYNCRILSAVVRNAVNVVRA